MFDISEALSETRRTSALDSVRRKGAANRMPKFSMNCQEFIDVNNLCVLFNIHNFWTAEAKSGELAR